jgi:VRR-NUC domain
LENPFPKPKQQPELEKSIQKRITKALAKENWWSKWTHGNKFQSGVPDMYAFHPVYKARWIEVKKPKGSRLEDTQLEVFAAWEERRIGVWVLTDEDIPKLLEPPNWREFDTGREIKKERVERRASSGKERDLQEAIKRKLRDTGWHCVDLHGNTFSHGFPDLYACHRDWGSRWIEVKAALKFTPSQKRVFREMTNVGAPIWVLRNDDVRPLFRNANIDEYSQYLTEPKSPFSR